MTIAEEVKAFVARELLRGADEGLTESTPLLELGVIDSLSVAKLLTFVRKQFGVQVPHAQVTPHNLSSIRAISEMVANLKGTSK